MRQQILNLFTTPRDMSWEDILLNIVLAAVLGFFIFLSYAISHRGTIYSRKFNASLVILAVLTGTVMTVIGNNIALSLGMVGALSIVRFRSAIKDPLDIGFLFWGIAAGITAGAGLYFVALMGTAIIAVIYIVLTLTKKQKKNYLLIVRYGESSESNIDALLGGMKYKLKNKTQTADEIELTIEVKVKNNDTSALSRFKAVDGVTGVTLLEYSGEYMN